MRTLCVAILALLCPIQAAAQEAVFFGSFNSGDTANWWAPARAGETGQTTCYTAWGAVIGCAETGQDGDIQPGVTWPNPRFVDNLDGTVTDMLTGLIWLKDASCADLEGTDAGGSSNWETALGASVALANGTCGLNDASVVGDWRLPSINELLSLMDYEYHDPPLSDAVGTAQWSEGNVFLGAWGNSNYWSSTSCTRFPSKAWCVYFFDGSGGYLSKTAATLYVWPVRGGL